MIITAEQDDRSEPTLIAEPGDAVGFLDAPGLEADMLAAVIDEALETLGDGSVLTVYNDDPAGRAAIEELCDRDALELVATIRHPEGGTTYTIREQS